MLVILAVKVNYISKTLCNTKTIWYGLKMTLKNKTAIDEF